MALSGTASATFSRADLLKAIKEKEDEIQQKTRELKELKELLQCLTPEEEDADSEPIVAADVSRRLQSEGFDQAEALAPLITPPPSRSVGGPTRAGESRLPSATPPPASFNERNVSTEYSTAGKPGSDALGAGQKKGLQRKQTLRPPPGASVEQKQDHVQAWGEQPAGNQAVESNAAGDAIWRKQSEPAGVRKLSTESTESEAYKGSATLFQEMGAAWREKELLAQQQEQAGPEVGNAQAHTWMSPDKFRDARDAEFALPPVLRSSSFANAKDAEPEEEQPAPAPTKTPPVVAVKAGHKPPPLNVNSSGQGSIRGADDGGKSDTLVAAPAKGQGSHTNKEKLSLFEFKVKVEQNKKVEYLVLDIRDNLYVFRQALSEIGMEFEDGKGDEIWSAQIHCLNADGDVRSLVSEEVFDEVKEEYLQSEGHVSLQPLHMICLDKEQDILSLVKIPPHKGSEGQWIDKPMAWKQGKMLGQGAFGSVYMAMKGDGEIIAVKRIEIPAGGTEIIDSFLMESQLLQRLEHPNIVRYISSKVVSKALAVIWIEYVPGGSVANILQVFGAISEDLVRRYLLQILKGLVYLHENNVIHRDLKPGNILVAVDGVVKLSDFGASMSVSASITSQQFGFAGTPNYIAPEMLRSRGPGVYSFNIDVWSLGMTVIEMLTASMPFEEFTNPFAVMFQIAKLEEPPVIPDYFSEDAKSFLQKCLDPNPDTRPHAKDIIKHPFITGNEHLDDKKSVPKTPKLKRTRGLRRPSLSDDDDAPIGFNDPELKKPVDEETSKDMRELAELEAAAEEGGDKNARRRMSSCELPYGVSVEAMELHGIEACMRNSVHATSSPGDRGYIVRSPSLPCSPDASRAPVYLQGVPAPPPTQAATMSTSPTGAATFMASMPPAPFNSKESNHSGTSANVNLPPQRPLPVPPPNKAPATRNADASVHASTVSAVPQSKEPPAKQQNRRLAPPPPLQMGPDPSEAGKFIAWQYYHHSRWRPFDAKASGELEEAFQAKKERTTITLSTDSRWGTQYNIDFKALQQTNCASGFIRPIRRLTTENEEDVEPKAEHGELSRQKSQGPFMWAGLAPNGGGGVNVGVLPTTNEQLSHFLRQKASVESEEIRGLKDSFKSYARKALWNERQHKHQEKVVELEKLISSLKEQLTRPKASTDKAQLEKALKQATVELEKEKGALDRAKREMESPHGRDGAKRRPLGAADADDKLGRRRSSGAELKKLEENKVTRKDLKHSKSGANSLTSSIQSVKELTQEMLETAQLVPAAMLLPGGLFEGWPAITGLYVGNTYNGTVMHTGASEAETRQPLKDQVLLHSWTMFVRQSEGRPLEIVRKVCFTIWPLKANQATMELRSEPFEVTRCSSAPFDVGVDIHLNKGKKVFKLQHFLCLTMSGGWSDDRNSTESDCFPVTHYAICIKPSSTAAHGTSGHGNSASGTTGVKQLKPT